MEGIIAMWWYTQSIEAIHREENDTHYANIPVHTNRWHLYHLAHHTKEESDTNMREYMAQDEWNNKIW